MDVSWQLAVAHELMDWLLSTFAHNDHWIQEEEAWTPV